MSLAGVFDELWRLTPQEAPESPEALRRFVRGLPGGTGPALDLGAGDGALSASLGTPELTVADVSLEALKRARRRVPHATLALIEPGRPLPFRDGAFAVALCAGTLDLVPDLQRTLAELRRVLVPDGVLGVAVPALGRAAGLRLLLRGDDEERFDPLGPPRRHFSAESLGYVLELAGLEVEALRHEDGLLLARALR